MSNHKKKLITDKHIELIAHQDIKLIFPVFGNVTLNIPGKITGRIRNRFKQFVFSPTFPFMSVAFASSDVEKMEVIDNDLIITLNQVEEKKKRRKKKKPLPVVEIEPSDAPIDLNKPVEITTVIET